MDVNKKRPLAVFSWSGGKDSAHALWKVLRENRYEVVSLLTTVNEDSLLSTMHDIPLELLQAQSCSIGIPLEVVKLRAGGGMEDYGEAMGKAAGKFAACGVTHFIYGDIFLHDIRSYREKQLAPFGIEVVEPLWDLSPVRVMEDFLQSGFCTVIVTTTDSCLGRDAVGKELDRSFVGSLPGNCDLNGENGEYHTFCYDGPIFSRPVRFRMGEPVRESYDIRLDDGSVRTFSYWFSVLSSPAGSE